ncbi:MAG TPA: hypothetical protein VMS98_15485 [Thermoanaerobaculia bacterium]|nr:hypothetical protein [Thermoanaerobaculia bacterium]
MKLTVAGANIPEPVESDIETLLITGSQMAYLHRQSKGLNPDMPVAFGAPHAIRTLLEQLEEAGVDLTSASTEQEVTRTAVDGLRRGRR